MMKLSEKILSLRKQKGLSQEELADRLNVSRQAISRWEVGSAQPDASNILQLSKLFDVTTDYLLNDDYDCNQDIPAVNMTETKANSNIKKIVALCISILSLIGNLVIYILSRFIKVVIPQIKYENGQAWYVWSGEFTGHSYKYFIQEYDLEFLTILLWGLFLICLIYGLANTNKKNHAEHP